jgi:MFS superfamily sulfate permease-like transporter
MGATDRRGVGVGADLVAGVTPAFFGVGGGGDHFFGRVATLVPQLSGTHAATLASILLLLARTSTPHVAVLGRIPGTERFSDLARNPDNQPTRGLVAFRVEASLVYFNVDHVLRTVRERLAAAGSEVRTVVCDLSTSPYVDLAGARMLRQLADDAHAGGASLRIVEARGQVRDLLRAVGLEEQVGRISRRDSLAEAVADAEGAA